MNYTPTEVVHLNPALSTKSLGRGRVVASVSGEVKLIQCSPRALDDVLAGIDGTRTFAEVEEALAGRYPLDGIRAYLDVLIEEGLVFAEAPGEKGAAEAAGASGVTLLVAGEGRACDAVVRVAAARGASVRRASLDDVPNLSTDDFDAAVVCPDVATYAQMLAANRVLVTGGRPYVPLYFSGAELVCGAAIIPGRTACFECQTTYHLEAVNGKLAAGAKPLAMEDLLDVSCAYALPGWVDQAFLDNAAATCADDAIACAKGSVAVSCLDGEHRLEPAHPHAATLVTYVATTQCSCCHGRCDDYRAWSGVVEPDVSSRQLSTRPIVYSVGGMRSCSDEDTRRMIDAVLARSGLSIEIKRMMRSPLQNVLPCYRATLKASGRNNTPYAFRDVVSRGKGLTERQSYLSAAFELMERASVQFDPATTVIEAPYGEVRDIAIDLEKIASSIVNPNTGYDRFSPEAPVDWVWATSLVTGERRLVPACMVFLGDVRFKGQIVGTSSSGLSAGACLEDAILQGLHEVIEHDAWMIGQANPVRLPVVDVMSSGNEALKERVRTMASYGFETIVRDYTGSFGIPVFRAWIYDPKNLSYYAVSGFGASLDPEISLERCITEAALTSMYSTGRTTRFGVPSAAGLANSVDSLYGLPYFQWKDISPQEPTVALADHARELPQSAMDAVRCAIGALRENDPALDVLYVDLTREVLEVPAVRVIVTGDIQRLGQPLVSVSRRMFSFCRDMGYGEKTPALEELYLGPYPH